MFWTRPSNEQMTNSRAKPPRAASALRPLPGGQDSGRAVPGYPLFAVFDCDGTLVDTHASIVHCMSLAFEAAGRPKPAPAAIRATIGLPLGEGVRELLPDGDEHIRARIVTAYREAFFDTRRFERIDEPLFPGIADLLDALESQGVILGIATGKIERALNMTLERHGLLGRFATRQTADHGPGKPDPAMLVRAMAAVGAAPARTVMIGDSHYDIRMGKSAGTAAVGVVWGQNDADELARAGADFVARAAGEILDWLSARNG